MRAIAFLWTTFIGSVALVMRQERTRTIGLVLIGLLATGTVFYTLIERWDPLDALYFSVTTLATVGYGDFAPATAIGKIFTIFFVLAGVGVLVVFASEVARQTISRTTDRVEERHAQRLEKEMAPQEVAAEEPRPN